MFGPSGHLYVYFTYGMHVCANIVCGPPGTASGILLRGAEVVAGADLARVRRAGRGAEVPTARLARGPALLTRAAGIRLDDTGAPIAPVATAPPTRFTLRPGPRDPRSIRRSPRTGVSGVGGGDGFPWRFFLDGEPSVSPYRAHVPRRR